MRLAATCVHLGMLVFVCAALAGNTTTTQPSTSNLLDGVGDGRTKNTAALQKAIDAASAAGGGTVFVPAGRWLTGGLVLKDHVTLHLDNGAVLLGSTDIGDYPRHQPAYRSYSDTYVNQALIYAENAHDIAIIGQGTIDGQGGDPAFAPQRDGKDDWGFLRRPYLIRFVTCTRVHVEGVRLCNSPMWTQQYLACDDVTIRALTVNAGVNNNNDMIDIDGCSNVRMSDCLGDSEDDGITLKSTGPRACENVTISNCTVGSYCNAIKLGTESTGGFRNITITNIAVRPARLPAGRFKPSKGSGGISLMTVDGGTLENVTISNIVIEGTLAPIFMRLGNRARKYAPEAPAPPVGEIRNVTISNVIARGAAPLGSSILGMPGHPIENVTLRDISITTEGGGTLDQARRTVPEAPEAYPECTSYGTMPAYGMFVRHVRGLTVDNVRFAFNSPDQRPALVCDDVVDATLSSLKAPVTGETPAVVCLRDCSSTMVRGCIAPSPAATFLHVAGACRGISLLGNDLSETKEPWRIEGQQSESNPLIAEGNVMPDSHPHGE